jgi:hypothetical protein
MATLVLTAVGTAIGGPIGGMLGSVLGQRMDAQLFRPKARHGPRLGDLSVQTSSYGSAIPKLFGTMRVAGTVIWATELREHRSSSGGGKGQPRTTTYSYSANFAVALSGRAIHGVRRIWADGKLLKGAAGDFKTRTGFRLHSGSEDQLPDPLITSVEGAGQAPAYRGMAYAVFEGLQLADFGNRIPSLTFEVVADSGPVAIGAVAVALSEGLVRDGETPPLLGYAASGDSIRGAIEGLAEAVPLSLVAQEDGLELCFHRSHVPVELEPDRAGAFTDRTGGASESKRDAAASLPAQVAISYYDPERDYQTGLQRARRGGAPAPAEPLALPAALSAPQAKALAEYRLASIWAGRQTVRVNLPWRHCQVQPGARVRLRGRSGVWKVRRWTLERMVVGLELRRLPGQGLASDRVATAGRPEVDPDLRHGPTRLRLLDLPLYLNRLLDRPHLLVAAAGPEAGWRRAELIASGDGGGSWTAAGSTAAPATMGSIIEPPSAAQSALFDDRSSLVVELLSEAMWLESRTDAALSTGANLAAIGEELIQFGRVEPLGNNRFRLSRLLRGRFGTEWAGAWHQPGGSFVLIEEDALAPVDLPAAWIGSDISLIASGIGDEVEGVAASCLASGESLRPRSPVHLEARREGDGGLRISWVRRSRRGWDWLSGSDTPLAEEREDYRIEFSGPGRLRTAQTSEPHYLYTSTDQAADGAAGPLTVSVVQIGTFAASREARLTVDI